VVGGALFSADLNWFNELFKNGGLPYMDVISDHPYATLYITSPELQGLGEEMGKLQDLVKRYNNGHAKPIWITEIGWPTSWLHVSEHTQANYLVRSTVLSLAAGVQKIFWMVTLLLGIIVAAQMERVHERTRRTITPLVQD
jgi:hypothetical protein